MRPATDLSPMMRTQLDPRAEQVDETFECVDNAAALAEAEAALEPYLDRKEPFSPFWAMPEDDDEFEARVDERLFGFEGSVVA